jgi:RND family efflux transporter MFP subunit
LRIDRSGDQRRRPWGRVVLVLVLLVLGVAAVTLLLQIGSTAEVSVITVRQAAAGSTSTVLNASGYVTARRRATVAAMITGRLIEVRVEEGVPVTKGQVLARLEDAQFQAGLRLAESRHAAAIRAVEEVRARLSLAQLTLARTQRLFDEGVSGEADLDRARTEVTGLLARIALEEQQVVVAEREVMLRRTQLDDTIVRAPFDGIVISKDAQPGEMVSPISAGGGFTRTGICTIVDMGSLEIEVDVNESYISRIHSDQPVEAVLDAYPNWRIPAHVITTIPAADRQKATVRVRIGFEQLDPRILPDMGIKVAFHDSASAQGERRRPPIVVPRSAVRRDDGRDVVYLLRGKHVERRAVTLGQSTGDEVEVLGGLSAGERVVVQGPAGLTDGQKVSTLDNGS